MGRKIVVVGAGKLGRRWIDFILEEREWELRGIVEISEKIINDLKSNEKYRNIPFYSEIDEIKEEIDGVIIATPPQSHLEISKKAILKKINVLCEKPLTLNFDQISEIEKILDEKNVVFLVNQNQRSIPQLQVMRNFLREGRIGKISFISIYFSRIMKTDDWRNEISQPVLDDMSIHHFDDLRYVTGKELKEVKSCHTFNPPYSYFKGDASLCVNMVFEDDIFVNYYATWTGKGIQTDWTGYWIIEGENGVLYLKDGKVFYVYGKENPIEPDRIEYLNIPKEEFRDSLLWTLDKFKKAIEGEFDDEVRGITFKENIKSIKILEETYKFLRGGKDEGNW